MLPGRSLLKEVASTTFHTIIIGGGITGAGIARDASLRGLKVALFEQGDYASGTSSRTSKLIHGGIRYLEQGNLSLVFEASRERTLLQRLAPHLVRPIPFLFPIYKGDRWGKGMIKMGMLLYDLLALFRNIQNHKMLSPEETIQRIPGLSSHDLTGGALFYDCIMDDARLCLANILEAKALGAETRNYTRVTGMLKNPKGQLIGVKIQDLHTGEEAEIRGEIIINATGPWVDELCRIDSSKASSKLRRTRGSHILLPSLSGNTALVVRTHRDDRTFFIIPWNGMSLVGTTDIDFEGNLGNIQCPKEDLMDLLNEAKRFFPQHSLEPQNVIASFSGVRPLIDSEATDPTSISRETHIHESTTGLISITGGKFTTYRNVAEKIVDLILQRLPHVKPQNCLTHSKPLWGAEDSSLTLDIQERIDELSYQTNLQEGQIKHLIKTYGSCASHIFRLIQTCKPLGEALHPSLPYTKAEITYLIHHESALTLSDILRRRTSIALSPFRTNDTLLSNTLKIMGQELEWTSEEVEAKRRDYLLENPMTVTPE